MMKGSDMNATIQALQGHQRCLMAFPQPVGHVAEYGVGWVGFTVGADWAPGQVATQGQELLVTENLMDRATNVGAHHGFHLCLYGLNIGIAQLIEEATDGRVVPELEAPSILDGLIFHQWMRSQVQLLQVLAAGQGSQPKLQNQIATRGSILVAPWWNDGLYSLSHLQVLRESPPWDQHGVLGSLTDC